MPLFRTRADEKEELRKRKERKKERNTKKGRKKRKKVTRCVKTKIAMWVKRDSETNLGDLFSRQRMRQLLRANTARFDLISLLIDNLSQPVEYTNKTTI